MNSPVTNPHTKSRREKSTSIFSDNTEPVCSNSKEKGERGRGGSGKLEMRVVRVAEVSAVLSGVFFVVAYQANEEYSVEGGAIESTTTDILRLLSLVLSLCHLTVILRYHSLLSRLSTSQRVSLHLSPSKPSQKWLCLELALHCIVLPPRANYRWKVYMLGTYTYIALSDIALLVSLLRVYHLPRLYYWKSRFSRTHAYFFSVIEGVNGHSLWAWKSAMKTQPHVLLIKVWALLALLGGVALRTFENYVPGNKLDTLWSSFWAVVVPETTIGYGDMVPLTHMGRVTIVIAIAGGMAVYSYTITITHRYIDLSSSESQLYGSLVYSTESYRLRKPAAVMIQRWWGYLHNRWEGAPSLVSLAKANVHLRRFRLMRRELLSLKAPTFEDAVNQFESTTNDCLQREIARLQPVSTIEKQSQALNLASFSMRMKLKSISVSCRANYNLFLGREATHGSSAQTEELNPRRSMGSGSMKDAKRIFRARDSAFKKLIQVRTMLQGWCSTPDSAFSHQSQTSEN